MAKILESQSIHHNQKLTVKVTHRYTCHTVIYCKYRFFSAFLSRSSLHCIRSTKRLTYRFTGPKKRSRWAYLIGLFEHTKSLLILFDILCMHCTHLFFVKRRRTLHNLIIVFMNEKFFDWRGHERLKLMNELVIIADFNNINITANHWAIDLNREY